MKSRFEHWVFKYKHTEFRVLTENERNGREPTWFASQEAAEPTRQLVQEWLGARDYAVRTRRDHKGYFVEVTSLGHGISDDNPNPPERGTVQLLEV